MFVPITSIFQRRYEECNQGRPSPRAASKLDHHVNRDEARKARLHVLLSLVWWEPPWRGFWPRSDNPPGQWCTNTFGINNTVSPHQTLGCVFKQSIPHSVRSHWDSNSRLFSQRERRQKPEAQAPDMHVATEAAKEAEHGEWERNRRFFCVSRRPVRVSVIRPD